MNEFPYIAYQSSSKLTKDIAVEVRKLYDEFADHGGDVDWREPRSTLIILDWNFDQVMTVMHDFTYASQVSDFIGINEHKEVTVKNHAEGGNAGGGEDEDGWDFSPKKAAAGKTRQHKLNRADKMWTRYKGKHFADTMKSLAGDMDKFSKENTDVAKLRQGQELELTETVDLFRKMPKYKELTIQFTTHIELCQEIIKKYKANKIPELIKVEQEIITGVNEEGKEQTYGSNLKKVKDMKKKINEEDFARLVMIFFSCYISGSADKEGLSNDISDWGFWESVRNFIEILPDDGSAGSRRFPIVTRSEFQEMKKKIDES